jgi:hypothetical protein
LNRIIKISGWTGLKPKLRQLTAKNAKKEPQRTQSSQRRRKECQVCIGHSEPKAKNQAFMNLEQDYQDFRMDRIKNKMNTMNRRERKEGTAKNAKFAKKAQRMPSLYWSF